MNEEKNVSREKVLKSLERLTKEAGFDVIGKGRVQLLTMLLRDKKVIYTLDGRIYDFGYIGQTGKAIIYKEGERSGQDSYAVDIDKLEIVKNDGR